MVMLNDPAIIAAAREFGVEPPTVEMISQDKLIVDPEVQRSLIGARVQKISKHFNATGLGFIIINQRNDGNFHVVDGQHRLAACQAVKPEPYTADLLAVVWRGLTKDAEAKIFLLHNDTRATGSLDTWRMRVKAGDPAACGQLALLEENGWKVGMSATKARGRFLSLSALDRIWNTSRDLAGATIRTLTTAYGINADGTQKVLLLGLAAVLNRYGYGTGSSIPQGGVDLSRMAVRLKVYDGGALGLLTAARSNAKVHSMRVNDSMSQLMVATYNYQLQTRRLPPWQYTNARRTRGQDETTIAE